MTPVVVASAFPPLPMVSMTPRSIDQLNGRRALLSLWLAVLLGGTESPRPAASGARGAEDRTAQLVDRGQGDGLAGREPRGVALEARREPRALRQLEEADCVRRLGLVARGCHTDHRPRDEPAAPREGDVAAVGGAARGAGASPIERERAAAGAATGRERQSLPRNVTVLTTPVPPRLWARATSGFRTWFAASPRSCRTSS